MALFGGAANAAPAEPLPAIADFFPDQSTGMLRLSPEGDALAYINTSELPHRLEVVDLTTMTLVRSATVGVDRLSDVQWATNDRLLLTAIVPINLEYRGRAIVEGVPSLQLVALDREGGNAKILLDDKKFQNENFNRAEIASVLPDDPDHIMMTAGRRDRLRLLKVNIHTGDIEEVEKGTNQTRSWRLDRAGNPLVRFDSASNGRWFKIRTRAPGETKWETLVKVRYTDVESLSPIAQADAPHRWYIAARGPRSGSGPLTEGEEEDRSAIWIYDLETKSFGEKVYAHPDVDVYSGHTNNVGEFIGAVFDDGKLSYDFADNRLDKHYKALDKFFGEEAEITFESVSRSGSHWLLHIEGPREPGSHYVYDVDRTHAEPLGSINPDLKRGQLGRMEVLEYAARDGLTIPAYLTRPVGRALGEAPLVVLPHGGPQLRDSYGFDRLAQFLASRGYAVFQPNFRGSSGYGEAFLRRGDRQWGRAMQDDITDGVEHLVAAGKAKRDKIAIVGGSYGGYAALMGLVRDPDLYQCGVSFNGVTDLEAMMKSDEKRFGRRSDEYESMQTMLGDRRKDREEMAEFSPTRQAHRINVPVLLLTGEEDVRVDPEQSTLMAQALRAAGKDVRHVEYGGADHSLWGRSPAARATETTDDDDYHYAYKAMMGEVENFLTKCFGGEGRW